MLSFIRQICFTVMVIFFVVRAEQPGLRIVDAKASMLDSSLMRLTLLLTNVHNELVFFLKSYLYTITFCVDGEESTWMGGSSRHFAPSPRNQETCMRRFVGLAFPLYPGEDTTVLIDSIDIERLSVVNMKNAEICVLSLGVEGFVIKDKNRIQIVDEYECDLDWYGHLPITPFQGKR